MLEALILICCFLTALILICFLEAECNAAMHAAKQAENRKLLEIHIKNLHSSR